MKKSLVIIGEKHDEAEGAKLLKKISFANSYHFFEIDFKWNIFRLYHIWSKAESEISNIRKSILGSLAFSPTSYCVDLDYTSRQYQNSSMREKYISHKIKEHASAENLNILFIGFSHVSPIFEKLKEDFDIFIFLPKTKILLGYADVMALVSKAPCFFYNDKNLDFGVEQLNNFLEKKENPSPK